MSADMSGEGRLKSQESYLDRSEQQELLRRRTEEQRQRRAATAEERRTRQRERQRQRREAERERNKGKFRWTPAQRRLFDEIERVNRATPEAREVVFWREVERAEGVCFMGRDDEFGDGQRQRRMNDLLDRWREWITHLPWSERDEWRREYLRENPDKAVELDDLRRSDWRYEHVDDEN